MMQWDNRANCKLLQLIMKSHSVTLDYDNLAKQFGEDVTSSALQTQIKRLRAKSYEPEPAEEVPATQSTPKKRAGDGTKKEATSPKKLRVKATKGAGRKSVKKGTKGVVEEEGKDGEGKSEEKDTTKETKKREDEVLKVAKGGDRPGEEIERDEQEETE